MTEQVTDHSGRFKRTDISDEELLLICLKNAPEGTNRKQVIRLIKEMENNS